MNERFGRFVPLAAIVFAALTVVGYTTIGTVPDSDAPISKITHFYAVHHGRVGVGGWLLAWAAIFLAVFGTAIWARIRRTTLHPLLAGAALLGTAVAVAGHLAGATTYYVLGDIGHKPTISAGALQAWHILGSDFGFVTAGGILILLLAVAAAGIAARAFPRWLAWTALPLGILQLTPIGFFASLLFLLWAAVTGIAMVVRPADTAPTPAYAPATAPHPDPALTSS